MALKLNIRPDLEAEMESLIPRSSAHSKTEYINQAIHEYNQRLKRQIELRRLKGYFQSYKAEGKEILSDFSKLKPPID